MVFGILLKVIKMILGGFAPGPKHEPYEGFVTSFHAIIFPSPNSIFPIDDVYKTKTEKNLHRR